MLTKSKRKELLKEYFLRGFSYEEIINLLESCHGAKISLRQLHRILREERLYRRIHKSSLNSVISFIDNEVQNTSGACFGYRLMHQKLRSKGYVVDRETVRIALKILDPDGVEQRSRHKLKRRQYISAGPNYTWHLDGYDKLKPYGFPIHGATDGYSRKILWLKVGSTNNDPKVTASYFLECVKELTLIPRLVRADHGTENIVICGLQRFFRRSCNDSHAGTKSFLYGTSTSNQRIESWWSILRKSRATWWINFFKDMVDEGYFDPGLRYHLECIRFCFMAIIQKELDETRTLWNSHRIRHVNNSECPGGRPDFLYFNPQPSGGTDCKFPISNQDIVLAEEQCENQPLNFGCSQEFIDLASTIIEENNLDTTPKLPEAKILYLTLIEKIDAY